MSRWFLNQKTHKRKSKSWYYKTFRWEHMRMSLKIFVIQIILRHQKHNIQKDKKDRFHQKIFFNVWWKTLLIEWKDKTQTKRKYY